MSLAVASATAHGAETNEPPAKLSVKGYGLFGNRELKNFLNVLQKSDEKPLFFDANFIEDAALILFSKLERDGFLRPRIGMTATLANGEEREFQWTEPLAEPIPRPLEAKRLDIRIDEGVLFYYDFIQFDGINALSLDDAAHFFIETDALIPLKQGRIYEPARLSRGVKNLEEALARLGYESASAFATNLVVQTNTGAVRVDIFVTEGPKSVVRSISEITGEATGAPHTNSFQTNVVFSQLWLQDYEQNLKNGYYKDGFAEASVDARQRAREMKEGQIEIDLEFLVEPGPVIHVGKVRFEGEEDTRESMMSGRVRIADGDLLDPNKAEQGRYRLARLGIFDSVELDYEEKDEATRDVIYTVKEGKEINFSLLAGYGSYEQLRGGIDLEQYNLWGLGHSQRLRAVQSFKSSLADYTYTVPDLFGKDVDGFLNASWLRREEISFQREEFGGGAGVRRSFKSIFTDAGLRYNYQVLNATDSDAPETEGLKSATVGAVILDLRHDRRDNPLTPRTGYKIFTNLEVASETLGGEVDYQRVEAQASYHLPLGRTRWIHFGVSHGFVMTPEGPARDLPFNRRFFPGGDTSIRGYQFGEAAPRDEDNTLVGAESYALGNVEFEQGLTRSLSLVAFFDALGTARRIGNYPFDSGLYSAGGGLRWKTIIGPVRLEYGHNLNPREEDPSGTFHLSIGFPF